MHSISSFQAVCTGFVLFHIQSSALYILTILLYWQCQWLSMLTFNATLLNGLILGATMVHMDVALQCNWTPHNAGIAFFLSQCFIGLTTLFYLPCQSLGMPIFNATIDVRGSPRCLCLRQFNLPDCLILHVRVYVLDLFCAFIQSSALYFLPRLF